MQLALGEPELSLRELAARFTDTKSYFISEASVYRLLKAHDLIPSPTFIVVKAADAFKDKTTAPNQLWQTDFTSRSWRRENVLGGGGAWRDPFQLRQLRRNTLNLTFCLLRAWNWSCGLVRRRERAG